MRSRIFISNTLPGDADATGLGVGGLLVGGGYHTLGSMALYLCCNSFKHLAVGPSSATLKFKKL